MIHIIFLSLNDYFHSLSLFTYQSIPIKLDHLNFFVLIETDLGLNYQNAQKY